ncbi:MAG TPA: HD domain-containing protein [Gemmatimonadaceae bacterium]|nr:HD domain-containing protein [Gemmatimonadaceae bacterium]
MTGYSDNVDHALAFAAKHHDQQVRKGTRLPYLTAAPMVAVILARYGRDDDTLVAGILHDVVEDSLREGQPSETLQSRVGDKFGRDVLASLLGVVERRYDDEGVELSADERREDLLERLTTADPRGLWVVAAEQLHSVCELLSKLRRTQFPEAVWSRGQAARGEAVRWHERLAARLRTVGFTAPIMTELESAVSELSRMAEAAGER